MSSLEQVKSQIINPNSFTKHLDGVIGVSDTPVPSAPNFWTISVIGSAIYKVYVRARSIADFREVEGGLIQGDPTNGRVYTFTGSFDEIRIDPQGDANPFEYSLFGKMI